MEQQKRWYVFDQFDTFFSFPTVHEAAVEAEHLKKSGMTGIHIVQMTAEQFDKYCENSDLDAAIKVK
jgi:hypothetical protein